MKRKLTLLVLAVMLLPAATCLPDQQFVKGVKGYNDVILPEYRTYIQNDPNLSEEGKKIRLESADGLEALVKEAEDNE